MLRAQEPGVGLSDMVGNRKLVAIGALLGWLLVLHLLVNVWLLCILSGLLAVLGGWFGSQAVIGTRNRVHLERFLLLEPYPGNLDAEKQLDEEIETMIQKIIRDFVSSWYRAVSREQNFEWEVRKAMMGLAQELKRRLALVDKQALTQRVLLLGGCHLQAYKKAREKLAGAGNFDDPAERASRLWREYCELSAPHTAVRSPTNEVDYARRIVDLLLRVLVPETHLETRTGRFVVVELVTCNVLLPMINKMADPDWLNLLSLPLPFPLDTIPEVRMLSPRGSESSVYDTMDALEYHQLERKEPISRELSAEVDGRRASSTSASSLQPDPLGSFFPCEYLDIESPMSDVGRDSGSVVLMSTEEFLTDSLGALEGPDRLDQEGGAGIRSRFLDNGHGCRSRSPSLSPCPDILIEPAADKEETFASLAALLEDSQKSFLRRPSYLERDLVSSEGLAHSPQDLPSLLSSSPTAPMGTFSFEPLSSPDGPVVIQNLRITGTITAREHSGTGFHPYTLYTVKYETTLDSENTSSVQQVAYHTVNRRYREFLNLQTRLEEKADLRKFIKNVKGPKKLFPDLPFGNMDTEKVEARKSLLESFLKQLCAIPEITNSEEMQEFLALNTDARIAFVKKPFVVSRIDKIVMNAIVDTLKTAFPRSEPQSPTEELSEAEVDGKSQKANKSRLRFASSKIAPVLNVTGTQEKIMYSLKEGTSAVEGLSLARMESFIQKQEKLLKAMLHEGLESEGNGEALDDLADHNTNPMEVVRQPAEGSDDQESETPLADIAVDLLRLVMVDHWSWLCTENMQKVLHLLFGTLIQRWLEVQVDNLTCTQRWVQYLRLLQESIWPGGVLPEVPKPLRTEEQKAEAEKQALQVLMGILPEIILEILGIGKCQESWSLVLESMQHPIINRHMVYCLSDILLEFLIPELQVDKPQPAPVGASVCGATERASFSSH
ncbi:PREDICTED: sorting nexin-19 [Gekko japonicus]|uniref:Sorting nexin-19 n=1 Tax=Gekko japonicus TaxID=146911 RepID=A0ABM1L7R3_GEKJA|nr:PREDICTED: sorting nexin-19 [Gekko japonicus]